MVWSKNYDIDTGLSMLVTELEPNEKRNVFYPSTRTMANLVFFALKRNLAGILAFSIQNDDFSGKCPTQIDTDTFDDIEAALGMGFNHDFNVSQQNESDFPLLKTINKVLSVNLTAFFAQLTATEQSTIDVTNKINQTDGQNHSSTISCTLCFVGHSVYLPFIVVAVYLSFRLMKMF